LQPGSTFKGYLSLGGFNLLLPGTVQQIIQPSLRCHYAQSIPLSLSYQITAGKLDQQLPFTNLFTFLHQYGLNSAA
jgi:hypothetical protein